MALASSVAVFYRSAGELIRGHRNRLGLTQEELGRRLRLSRTAITNIEKGRQQIALHQLVAFAAALKVQLVDLVPRSRDTEGSQPELPAALSPDEADWARNLLTQKQK